MERDITDDQEITEAESKYIATFFTNNMDLIVPPLPKTLNLSLKWKVHA